MAGRTDELVNPAAGGVVSGMLDVDTTEVNSTMGNENSTRFDVVVVGE